MKNIILIAILIFNSLGVNAQNLNKIFVAVEKFGVPIIGVNPNPPYEEVIIGYHAPAKLTAGSYNFILGTDTNHVVISGQYGDEGAFGMFKYFNVEGNLVKIENWNEGKQNGICLEFDNYGNIICVRSYQNGTINGDEYITSKELINLTRYLNGKRISNEWFNKRYTIAD